MPVIISLATACSCDTYTYERAAGCSNKRSECRQSVCMRNRDTGLRRLSVRITAVVHVALGSPHAGNTSCTAMSIGVLSTLRGRLSIGGCTRQPAVRAIAYVTQCAAPTGLESKHKFVFCLRLSSDTEVERGSVVEGAVRRGAVP